MPRKQPKLVSIGYDGKFELGLMEVVDPYEGDTRKKNNVAVNIKHDIMLSLYSRRQIEEHQYRAGNKFLALVEASGASRGLAVDPTREPVDGRGDTSSTLDSRLRAARELAGVERAVGYRGYRIARLMILNDPDTGIEKPTDSLERRYLFRRFREVLTDMAICFGYMGRPNDYRRSAPKQVA